MYLGLLDQAHGIRYREDRARPRRGGGRTFEVQEHDEEQAREDESAGDDGERLTGDAGDGWGRRGMGSIGGHEGGDDG